MSEQSESKGSSKGFIRLNREGMKVWEKRIEKARPMKEGQMSEERQRLIAIRGATGACERLLVVLEGLAVPESYSLTELDELWDAANDAVKAARETKAALAQLRDAEDRGD